MNGIDALLLAALLLFAVLGWRIGLLRGVASLVGVAVGGLLGVLAGDLAGAVLPIGPLERALVIVVVMGVASMAVQWLLTKYVQPFHDGVETSRAAVLNRSGGALLTSGLLVVLIWAAATALALLPASPVGALMRGSTVLVGLDRLAPADAGLLFDRFPGTSGRGAPRIFTGLGLVPPPEVPVPDASAVTSAMRRTAGESVVRVTGQSTCGMVITGSGVVVAHGLVLTNAHVVAGVPAPTVVPERSGSAAPATVVRFDPTLDMALLRVPGLPNPPVQTGRDPDSLDVVSLAGYPDGGPQRVVPARVRGAVEATGEDLYGRGEVHRPVLILAGTVLPGDSGGPLLDEQGRMAGLVFAATLDGASQVGYALPLSTARAFVEAGPGAAVRTEPLPQDCRS